MRSLALGVEEIGLTAAVDAAAVRDARAGPSPGPRALEARGIATARQILVQLAEAELRPQFAESCRAFGDITWCDDLDELASRASDPGTLAAVVDLVDRSGHGTHRAVSRIRARRPELPIVVWCDREPAILRLGALLAAGVSAVIFREETDFERRLLSVLTIAHDTAFQQLTEQALQRRVPPPFIPVVRYCLDHAASTAPLGHVARSMGLRPSTLAAQLRRGGLPPVGALSSWSKALWAAYRLEKTNESVTWIARSLGFSSAATLRRLLRRCTNETPQALREPDGFGWTLRCFERYLVKAARARR